MANWTTAIGNTISDEAETCRLTGYNANGDEVAAGTPVCWDELASGGDEGRAFKEPATANFNLVAGVAEEAVGTAQYTARIVAYGPGEARTYGVATTFIPGANLILVTAKDYLVYDSAQLVINQPRVFTAIDTNATVDTNSTTIFVRAL